MNYKQKLGYTVLGAVIMLVGLGLGAIVSPPLIAQRNDVLDEIRCSSLTVVDKRGEPVVVIASNEEGNGMILYDQAGKDAAILHTKADGTTLSIYRPGGTRAASLVSNEDGGGLGLFDNEGEVAINAQVADKFGRFVQVYNAEGEGVITLGAFEEFDSNLITVRDQAGALAVVLDSTMLGNNATVYDTAGNIKWRTRKQ